MDPILVSGDMSSLPVDPVDPEVAELLEAFTANHSPPELNLRGRNLRHHHIRVIATALPRNAVTHTLDLAGNAFGDAGALALGDALAQTSTLKVLRVDDCGIGPTGMAEIARGLRENRSLTQLHLFGNRIEEAGAVELVHSLATNRSVTALDMGNTNLGNGGLRELTKWLSANDTLRSLGIAGALSPTQNVSLFIQSMRSNYHLTFLDLSHTKFNEQAMDSLSGWVSGNRKLKTLALDACVLGDAGIQRLSTALTDNHSLKSLSLRDNGISKEGAKHLGEALKLNETLDSLTLAGNRIRADGLRLFLFALGRKSGLRHIDLSDCMFGDEGARELAMALADERSTWTSLVLRNDGITDSGVTALSMALAGNRSVEILDLGANNALVESAHALAKLLLVNRTVRTLSIAECYVGDEGTAALAEAIRTQANTSEEGHGLESIDLSYTCTTDEGAGVLADVLKDNTHLTSLDVSGNLITDSGAIALAECLRTNRTLLVLQLAFTRIQTTGIRAFSSALEDNKVIQDVDLSHCRGLFGDEQTMEGGKYPDMDYSAASIASDITDEVYPGSHRKKGLGRWIMGIFGMARRDEDFMNEEDEQPMIPLQTPEGMDRWFKGERPHDAQESITTLNVAAVSKDVGSRNVLWDDWGQELADGEGFATDEKGQQWDFKEVFLRSAALEGMVESFILSPPDDDEGIIRIFQQCLRGDYSMHRRLLKALRSLAEGLCSYEIPPALLHAVSSAIAAYKMNWMEEEASFRVEVIDKHIFKSQCRIKEIDIFLRGQEGNLAVDTILERSRCLVNLLHLNEEKRRLLQANPERPVHLDEHFQNLEYDIGQFLKALDRVLERTRLRRNEFIRQWERAVSEREREMSSVRMQEKGLVDFEGRTLEELRRKKITLEKELERVTNTVKDLEEKQMMVESERQEVEVRYTQAFRSAETQEARLRHEMERQQITKSNMGMVESFVRDAWKSLGGHILQQTDLDNASEQYLLFLESLVKQQKEDLLMQKARLDQLLGDADKLDPTDTTERDRIMEQCDGEMILTDHVMEFVDGAKHLLNVFQSENAGVSRLRNHGEKVLHAIEETVALEKKTRVLGNRIRCHP